MFVSSIGRVEGKKKKVEMEFAFSWIFHPVFFLSITFCISATNDDLTKVQSMCTSVEHFASKKEIKFPPGILNKLEKRSEIIPLAEALVKAFLFILSNVEDKSTILPDISIDMGLLLDLNGLGEECIQDIYKLRPRIVHHVSEVDTLPFDQYPKFTPPDWAKFKSDQVSAIKKIADENHLLELKKI